MTDFISALKSHNDYIALNGADMASIESAESSLSLKFSAEYKNYLVTCGAASADGHEFTGIVDSKRLNVVDATIRAREVNPDVPADLYVVEEMTIDHIVIWQAENGSVYKTVGSNWPELIFDSLAEYFG